MNPWVKTPRNKTRTGGGERAPTLQMTSARALATLLFSALLITPLDAPAGTGIPRARRIDAEAGNPGRVVVGANDWGYYESREGTWSHVCGEAYDSSNLGTYESRPLVVLPGGDALIASPGGGLYRSRAESACGVTLVTALLREEVLDLAA